MTTEIVVMNREAVAMAADSAITIGGEKVVNTANKLYMLGSGYPVDIMIFSNATFMGLPWEIIINGYRESIIRSKKKFDKLESYASGFIQYIIDNRDVYSSNPQQEHVVFSHIYLVYDEITKKNMARV